MKDKKSIAFVIYSLGAGGAERVLSALANELSSKYNIYIITIVKCIPFYPLNEKIVLKYSSDRKKDSRNGVMAIVDNVKHIKNITRISKENKINLLIGFTTTANVFTIISSKLLGIKSIVSERNNPVLYPPNKFWTVIRNLTYPFTDCLIIQTKANKLYFQKFTNSKKISIILNPIAKVLETNRNVTFERNKKIILSVGRLNNNKSQDLLLKAFANIPNDGWQIFLVGDGPKKDDYCKLAKDLGIQNQVIFKGSCKDVHHFYNIATIFVFTSKSEGLPNALMEALYFGIPSISTNCPNGPSDLIRDKENGFLIEVDNQKELENKLVLLMGNSDIRAKFAYSARASAKGYEMEFIQKKWDLHISNLI